MADNPTVNGVPVAGDDIGGGVIVQRVKLNIGADGTGGAATDVYAANPLPVALPASASVASTTAVWANSAAVNTETYTALTQPSPNPGRLLLVIVRNPSTVTALTGKVRVRYQDPVGGTTRYADYSSPAGVSTFTVGVNNGDGQAFLVDGGLLTTGQVMLSNNTVLGGSDGFTASVQVHALCGI